MSDWKAVVGLEVHVQLDTKSKLFCSCPVHVGAAPNTLICEVCTGQPGTLPSLNDQAVRHAIKAVLALAGTVAQRSRFDRKAYFYPDLPKGYQLTQQAAPIGLRGRLTCNIDRQPRKFRIERLHLEEDSGKLGHDAEGSLVDWNRAGLPLLEIVSAPELTEGREAEAWLRMLHRVLVEAKVTRGDLEQGHFRCDANVSVHRPGQPHGARVELKNINSFRFVRRAVDGEIARQVALLEAGEAVRPATRGWDGKGSRHLRDKESQADYRFMPDPDLPELVLDADEVSAVMGQLPGPLDTYLLCQDAERVQLWRRKYGLDDDSIEVISQNPELEEFFRKAVYEGGAPAAMAGWIRGDLLRHLKNSDKELEKTPIKPLHLVELQALVDDGTITRATARRLFEWVAVRDGNISGLVAIMGLHRIDDDAQLHGLVDRAAASHPEEYARLIGGDEALVGFFIGKVVASVDGRAEPERVESLVRDRLARGSRA